jgi:hypothetical protein
MFKIEYFDGKEWKLSHGKFFTTRALAQIYLQAQSAFDLKIRRITELSPQEAKKQYILSHISRFSQEAKESQAYALYIAHKAIITHEEYLEAVDCEEIYYASISCNNT